MIPAAQVPTCTVDPQSALTLCPLVLDSGGTIQSSCRSLWGIFLRRTLLGVYLPITHKYFFGLFDKVHHRKSLYNRSSMAVASASNTFERVLQIVKKRNSRCCYQWIVFKISCPSYFPYLIQCRYSYHKAYFRNISTTH